MTAASPDPATRRRPWHRRWWAWSTWFNGRQLNDPRFLLRLWLIARGLVFAIWLILAPSTQGDVIYYFNKVDTLFEAGPRQTLIEYPTPVIPVLMIPWLLGFGTRLGYVVAFVVCMLALDALFTRSLWTGGGRLRGVAVVFWTIFLAFVGPTAYLRFDLIPAVLAGWALLSLVHRHHARAGALVGLGAATKLWPALLWPALLKGTRRQRLVATVAMFGTGGVLALGSLLWAGWDRLVSPLKWQSGRHLQVESVWAGLPMLSRLVQRDDYWVGISSFQAFEIWGPGVNTMLLLASVSSIIGYLTAIAAYVLWVRRGNQRLIEACVLMLFVVLVMIVTNKAFSPQYIMWVGGPLAAGLSLVSSTDDPDPARRVRDERRLIRTGSMLLMLTLLTQLVYPVGYAPLVKGSLGVTPVTLVLVARNVGIIVMLAWVLQWMWAFLRPARPRPIPTEDASD